MSLNNELSNFSKNNVESTIFVKQISNKTSNYNLIFDTERAKRELFKNLTIHEMDQFLAHLNCWDLVVNDNEISNDDYVLIAEASKEFYPDFYTVAKRYKDAYCSYDIIKLQNKTIKEIYSSEENQIPAIVYGRDYESDDVGAGLYLIRKRTIFDILAKFKIDKPYFPVDYFSKYYTYTKIAQATRVLAYDKKKSNNTQTPFFSIIVPIYNVASYLSFCIDSVLSQDFANYEIILVNDGSTDNSLDICVDYAKKYTNIKFIHKNNSGPSDTRNYGMHIASGQYILFLDSDDYWDTPNALAAIFDTIQQENFPDLVTYSYKKLSNTGELDSISLNLNTENNNINVLLINGIFKSSAWTKVVKRSVINKYGLSFPIGMLHEDFKWSFELLKYCKSFAVFNSAFYIYRLSRAGSITRNISYKNVDDLLSLITEAIQYALDEKWLELKEYVSPNYSYCLDLYEFLSEEEKAMLHQKLHQMKELWNELTV